MVQKFFIEGCLPGLNEILAESRRHAYESGKHKKKWQEDIQWQIKMAKIKPVKQARFDFIWFEKDKRRDKDNIAGGGRKYILDALVGIGILPGDGWKNVVNWTDHFFVVKEHHVATKNGGVLVFMYDVEKEFQLPIDDKPPVYGGLNIQNLENDFFNN